MWILNHNLDYHFVPGKVFTDIINYYPNTIKLELMNQTGTGSLQSFKVNVRPSNTYCVVECNFE